jgi:hypothetical protein
MANQSEAYKHISRIDELANLPGLDLPNDRLKVAVEHWGDNLPSIKVEPETGALFQVNQDSPVPIEDADGNQINPATEETVSSLTTLLNALDANDILEVTAPSPLDVSATTVPVEQQSPIDIADRAGRDLGAVSTPDRPEYSSVEVNETLAADDATTITLEAAGTTEFVGRLVSTGQFDVDVAWTLSDGSQIDSTNLATDQAADDPVAIDERAGSDRVEVTVTEKSSAEQTVKGVLTLA